LACHDASTGHGLRFGANRKPITDYAPYDPPCELVEPRPLLELELLLPLDPLLPVVPVDAMLLTLERERS